jgi:site-specific DNA-methyltransferase (adenine-specific)
MKPYYDDGRGIIIYHGDCRAILPSLPKSDFLFADPPYGVGFQYETYADSRVSYESTIIEWFDSFTSDRIAVTPGIVNTCLWPQPKWIIAWLKTNSMGASGLSGPSTVSRNLWEPVLWYGTYPANQMSRDTIKAPICSGNNNGHPCPKPIQLVSQLIAGATIPGHVVYDPFLGSGTTLRAAKDLGRHAIGIEIEERYCEIAARRLQQEVLQLT